MLLDVLTANPGSAEVEHAYLGYYRTHLKEVIAERSSSQVAKVP
jgi:hypothetical protein